MKIPHVFLALTCTLGLSTVLPSAHAGMFSLNPDASDAQVDTNGPSNTAEVTNQTNYQARIGESFAPGGASYVFPFLLPTLGAGESFTAASLRFQLFTVDNGGNLANADFYGLGVRTSNQPLATDYYQGTNDPNNTLIQAGILTPSTPVRIDPNTGFVTTSTAANTTLANYLNMVDPGGVNAGAYVFFRINYEADPIPNGNNAYNVLTEDAGGTNEKPLLSLTSAVATVPEPSTIALSMLSGIALLASHRRRNQGKRSSE